MANTVKPQQPQPLSNRPVVEDDNRSLEDLQVFYEKNKKVIGMAVSAVLLLTIAVVGYFYAYKGPREVKAAGRVFHAQQYFVTDSVEKALKGDGQHWGFLRVIKEYGGTKTGNLSHYYAGVCYLKMGQPKQAIKHLEDFDGEGTLIGSAANARLGDAYIESGNLKKGISAYEDAVENKEDNVQTPIYLMTLAAAYEQDKQADKAKAAYRRIRDEYPNSMPARDVDRYLARLGELE